MTQEPAIRFENVFFGRGKSNILKGITFEIARGETVVLVGRSGSGKTTTLKLVNRLLEPSEGRVFVEGKNTMDWDPVVLRRLIGYVIQEVGLFPHFTVRRNVGLVPSLYKTPTAEILARVEKSLNLVGLDPKRFSDRYPHQLSGGQRQRVGVARALASDPPILLMDEPFGALDPLTRSEIQDEFIDLQQKLRKTILFVTHDVAEAFLLGNRVGLMEEGKLIALGTREEFLESSDPSVISFLRPLLDVRRIFNSESREIPTR
jgi:osmoprotectant transport system ATP-binding protein